MTSIKAVTDKVARYIVWDVLDEDRPIAPGDIAVAGRLITMIRDAEIGLTVLDDLTPGSAIYANQSCVALVCIGDDTWKVIDGADVADTASSADVLSTYGEGQIVVTHAVKAPASRTYKAGDVIASNAEPEPPRTAVMAKQATNGGYPHMRAVDGDRWSWYDGVPGGLWASMGGFPIVVVSP